MAESKPLPTQPVTTRRCLWKTRWIEQSKSVTQKDTKVGEVYTMIEAKALAVMHGDGFYSLRTQQDTVLIEFGVENGKPTSVNY